MCVYALWARKCVHGMHVCACVHMCGGVNVGCVHAYVCGVCVHACAHVCAVCVCPAQGRPEVPVSVACLPPVCGALHPVSRLSGARVRFSSRRLPDRKPRQARGVPDGGERFLTNTTENDPRVQTDCRKQKRKPGGKAGRAKGTRSRHGRPGRDRAGAIGAVRQTPHGVTRELTPRGRRPRSHGTTGPAPEGRRCGRRGRHAPGCPWGVPRATCGGAGGVVQGTVLTGRTSISKGHVLSYGIFGGTCRRPRRTPEWPLGVRDGGRGAGTRGSPTRGGHWHSSLCTARQRPRPDARRSHVLAVTAGRLGEERGNAPNCF